MTIQEHTTMQNKTCLFDLEFSLYNQILSANTHLPREKFYKDVFKSFNGEEKTYDDIKMAKKKLWERTGKDLGIPQTKLLELIAKSMGYSGHHSMKKRLSERPEQTALIHKQLTAVEFMIRHSIKQLQNSPQMKLFQAMAKSGLIDMKDLEDRGVIDASK